MFNWGIIGAGSIAHRMADALGMVDSACKYAVGSRTQQKADQFKSEKGFLKAYGTYDELYSDPNVDIVYIATPHSAHAQCAIDAMNHGKHVLVEKPMTVNVAEAKALIECSKANNVFCMEALWIRFLPLKSQIDKWINGGEIGEIQSVYADFSIKVPVDDMNCRLSNPDVAGGALLDLGVYPLNIAAMFIGLNPSKIESAAVMSKAGVDINDTISMTYENGKTALLRTSLLFEGLRDATIDGDKGTIKIPNFICFDKAILYKNFEEVKTVELPYENGFNYEVEHVHNCILNGKIESDIMPLGETLKITEMMDSIRSDWNFKYPFE